MCQDCGCGVVHGFAIDGVRTGREPSRLVGLPARSAAPREHAHDHSHDKGHDHGQAHGHPHPDAHLGERRTVAVHEAILSKNDRLAERNRGFFQAMGVLVLNVLSCPGSGKTAFLERTLRDLDGRVRAAVVVGDLATDNDARRLREVGVPAVQVTTGDACHLDAEMVARAVEGLDLEALNLLFIENVGNLVCPAGFDLGEDLRVVLTSVTEGEDKPLKYPVIFRTAQVAVLSKTDLAEAVGLDRLLALSNLRRAAPGAIILEVSSRTGQGMEAWYAYLGNQLRTGGW